MPASNDFGTSRGRSAYRDEPADGEERKVVLEKRGVLIDGHKRAGDVAERGRHRGERADHEHHATGIDGAAHAFDGHEQVRQRECRAGDQAGQHRDARARSVHQLALPVQLLRSIAMAAEQVIREHVGADLFRGARLHEQVAKIFALTLLGGLLVEELVEPRGDAALEHERQDGGHQREEHEHPVQAGEQARHQHDGDDIAGEAEHRPGEIPGPPRDVALGAREPIVPVGVVEVPEVDL